jgi:hypothetical protein
MDIFIYGIIGTLAIFVCWLLDVYSPAMEKDSMSMGSTEVSQFKNYRFLSSLLFRSLEALAPAMTR